MNFRFIRMLSFEITLSISMLNSRPWGERGNFGVDRTGGGRQTWIWPSEEVILALREGEGGPLEKGTGLQRQGQATMVQESLGS